LNFYDICTIIYGIDRKRIVRMADVSMENFLLQYMMQMRIRKMDPEVMARFSDYASNEDFRGHMKDWRNKLMEQVDGKWVAKPLPDPNGPDYHLTDEEWKSLFKEFRSAFRTMAADRKKLEGSIDFGEKNDKALNFLDEYFGNGKLFSQATATPEAEAAIRELEQIIKNNKNVVERFLGAHNLISYTDLTNGLEKKKYNTSATFQKQLKEVASYMSYLQGTESLRLDFGSCDLEAITDGFTDDDSNLEVSPEFKAFKNGEYDIMLRKLYKTDKIRNAFPSDKIKTAYDTAKNLTGYDDENSKDYIPPKPTDELNIFQTMGKWADDTYADVFDKYLKFHGDRLYFSNQAKEIVAAIHKEKIKPTDGLDKIFASGTKIKEKLAIKSPTAVDHFDWFAKTMNKIKRDMPKAYEGALRNGRQMRAVVSEIIKEAVKNGKEKEAKTAMEVLSVVRYGFTTSQIMDNLKKMDVTIFSDGNLSFNKNNKGMQLINAALDKSIKYALLGVGYGITAVANAYSQRGMKFNKQRGDRLKNDDELDQERARTQGQLDRMETRLDETKDNRDKAVNPAGTSTTDIITETNRGAHDTSLSARKTLAEAEATRLDSFRSANSVAFDNVQRYKDAERARADADSEKTRLRSELTRIEAQINTIRGDATMTTEEREARIKKLTEEKLIPTRDKLQEAEQTYTSNDSIVSTISADPNWAAYQRTVNTYDADMSSLTAEQNDCAKLENRLNQWDNATKSIEELTKQINDTQETLRNWDEDHNTKYTELMAYWDMLETGRDFHTGKMYNWGTLSKKNAQKNFDAQKATIVSDYLTQYGRLS